MKKILSLLLVVTLLAVATFNFAACGSGSTKSANGQIEITYWSIYPEGGDYADEHKALIDKFEADNPDIKINHVGTNFWDYFDKLNTSLSGSYSIDVFWQDIVNVKFRADNGVTANLAPFLERDNISLDTWYEADIDTCSFEDGIYALPFESDARVLYYNKDHFAAAGLDPDSPPTTFEELAEYAEKLTILSEDGKIYDQIGYHPRLGNSQIQQIVWPMGGTFFDDEGNPQFDDPKVVEAVKWWVDVAQKFDVRPLNAFTNVNSDGTAKDQSFLKGKTSMVIDENGLAWQLEKFNPDLNYGVAPVPYVGDNRYNHSGGFTLEISNRTTDEKKEAAWRFVKYMTSYEVQSQTMEKLNFMPANVEAIEELKKVSDENQKKILEEFNYRRHVDYLEQVPEWWTIFGEELMLAEGKKKKPVEEAVASAQEKILNLIKEYDLTH